MEATHIVKVFINGGFVSEYNALEIRTSKEKAMSYCRIEEDGSLMTTHGMAFVDRSEEQVSINLSYDIFYFDFKSYEAIEKEGSYYYHCHSKAFGDDVEIFICKVDIPFEYDQCIHEYFNV